MTAFANALKAAELKLAKETHAKAIKRHEDLVVLAAAGHGRKGELEQAVADLRVAADAVQRLERE